jgi:hypothetical protein
VPAFAHLLLLAAGTLASTALSAYIMTRCDRRPAVAAVLAFQLGFFLLLIARFRALAAVTAGQRGFHAALGSAGWVLAASAGALFAALAAFQQREGWRAAGFALLTAAALASDSRVAAGVLGTTVPSATALLYMALAAYLFLARRHLFPELTRNVLEAAVFDSRDAVVAFDASGAYLDSGTNGLEGVVSFEGMGDIHDFLGRIRSATVEGRFFAADELQSMDLRGLSSEVSLAGRDGPRHYLVFANPVRPGPRSRLGSVCGFYDITDQKTLAAELVARSAELTDVNARLAGSLTVAEKLESERARRAVVEEVHRVLGRRIEELVEAVEAGAELGELAEGCRAIMAEVRSTVARLFSADGGKGACA